MRPCRNYAAAIGKAPREAGEFLTRLGLDIHKPFELIKRWREEDGRWLYSVLYHLAGTLMETGNAELELAPGVIGGFRIGMGPSATDFPKPCFQLFVDLCLPWLLDKPEPDDGVCMH